MKHSNSGHVNESSHDASISLQFSTEPHILTINQLFSLLYCNTKHIPLPLLTKLKIYGKKVLPDSHLDCYPYVQVYTTPLFHRQANTLYFFQFYVFMQLVLYYPNYFFVIDTYGTIYFHFVVVYILMKSKHKKRKLKLFFISTAVTLLEKIPTFILIFHTKIHSLIIECHHHHLHLFFISPQLH